MYKLCSLYSGSSGNATFIGNEHEGILIDAGKNCKNLVLALKMACLDPTAVKGLFITHEHSDHIGALRVFAKTYKIPVYANEKTLQYLDESGNLDGDFPVFVMNDYADIGDFHIEAHKTSHDTVDPQCYSILLPNLDKVSVVTDTGLITEETFDGIIDSKAILLESNHDKEMLSVGPYPYYLKRRILGPKGHLSNDLSSEMSAALIKKGVTKHILLGHLSAENNLPDLAFQAHVARLFEEGANLNVDYTLEVAKRHEPTLVEV